MSTGAATVETEPASPSPFGTLLGGYADHLRVWLGRGEAGSTIFCVVCMLAGSGLYGAAMGSWRAPLQALFVGLKFPLIVSLTTIGNALLNAMIAPLLGLQLSFHQSLKAVLMSFAITGAVLGAFSPVVAFVIWNCPPMNADLRVSAGPYAFIMLTHVVVIAFAGAVGTLRLTQLLGSLAPKRWTGLKVVAAWLVANLFLGSQLSWILRPFIGSPTLPVEFIRKTAFQGNFYEAVWASFMRVTGSN